MRAVVLPTGAFLTNRRGFPTLPRAHQELLIDFWRQGVQVLSLHLAGSLRHLFKHQLFRALLPALSLSDTACLHALHCIPMCPAPSALGFRANRDVQFKQLCAGDPDGAGAPHPSSARCGRGPSCERRWRRCRGCDGEWQCRTGGASEAEGQAKFL